MQDVSAKFEDLFGTGIEPNRFFCPGRVNIIGEHIDYLGGLVMPAAISLGITGIVRFSETQTIRLASTSFNGVSEFNLENLPNKKQGHWTDYVLGVINSVRREGISLKGFDLLLDSTLPKGSGLSSSAALEVLIHYMLHSLFGESEPDRSSMAVSCQKVENEFIGVQCGIMDQFAVANSKANCAMVLDCNSLDYTHVPFDLGDYSLVIINSKKPRELADSAYNQRRKECDEALQTIQHYRQVDHLVHANESDLDNISDPILKKRTKHAFSEQQRVLQSQLVLKKGDIDAFGDLLIASHRSLKYDFEVSCEELDFIVDFLTASEYCKGVRMTGAGFGGCCIAVIQTNRADELCSSMCVGYANKFGLEPNWFICKTANGVHSLT